MDGRPQEGRFIQVRRAVRRQPPGPLDPDIAGSVDHDLADFGIPQERSRVPVEMVSGVPVRSRRSYLARFLRSPIGVPQGQIVRLEVDPARLKRLRPVIGQADRLAVREQREVPRVKHRLALLSE